MKQRRQHLRIRMSYALAAAAALCGCGPTAPFSRDMQASRDQHAMPVRSNSHVHGLADGLAVSNVAGLAAVAFPDQAANELLLLDLETRAARRIQHPDQSVVLLTPTFSRDGQRLALVAAETSPRGDRTGVSTIWIGDVSGNTQRVIAQEGRLFAHPAFSPDGRRIAYFRDVFVDVSEGDVRAPRGDRGKPMALFELDLASGREVRLLPQAYSSGGPIAYVSDGRLLFSAGALFERLKGYDQEVWGPGAVTVRPGPGEQTLTPNVFVLNREQQAAQPLGGALPFTPGTAQASLMGVDAKGDAILFQSEEPDAKSVAWRVLAATDQGIEVRASGQDQLYPQQATVAPGGLTFGAVLTDRVGAPPAQSARPLGLLLGELGAASMRRIRLDDLSIAAEPIRLAQPARIASKE